MIENWFKISKIEQQIWTHFWSFNNLIEILIWATFPVSNQIVQMPQNMEQLVPKYHKYWKNFLSFEQIVTKTAN